MGFVLQAKFSYVFSEFFTGLLRFLHRPLSELLNGAVHGRGLHKYNRVSGSLDYQYILEGAGDLVSWL